MKRKNLTYSISDDDFKQIVSESYSCSEVLKKLGYNCMTGNSSLTVKRRIKELNINTSHWVLRHPENLTRVTYADDEYFKKGVYRGGYCTKKRILRDNLIEYKCAICGNTGEWNGKKLSLQLHHVNGDHLDNRLENLVFLCPNCHSQTESFAGKRKK